MKHIIFENKAVASGSFIVSELMQKLEHLTDSRQARGKRYDLPFLLVLILLAKIAGENKPTGIAHWLKLRQQQLITMFTRQRQAIPCLNTIRRTLANTILADELENILRQFLHQTYGGQQSRLVAIDGKTLRGTIAKGETKGVHLLSAYLPEEGLVLRQIAVVDKENEISAAPQLLQKLDLRQKIVCGDAMFTQRDLSVQIASQGGDFIWFVKRNQPQLQLDVSQFFVPPRKAKGWQTAPLPQTTVQQTEKTHGRLEQRRLTLMADKTEFIAWPHLKQVFKLERKVTHLRTKVSFSETVYGVTSLSQTQATADELLLWTRQYWGIENGLHYRRDKTLEEDGTRISDKNEAQVMAILNNFMIGLACKLGFRNMALAQRLFNAQLNSALLSQD